jgi:tetratricopeptide (TPR) repeat protein
LANFRVESHTSGDVLRRSPLPFVAALVVSLGLLAAWWFSGSAHTAATVAPAVTMERAAAALAGDSEPEPAAIADAGVAAAPKPQPPTEVGPVHLRLPDAASVEKRKKAATSLRERAQAHFKKKQFAQALPLYELAVRLDPDSPEGAERLGATYARQNDSIRAVYFYNRFLELAPTDPLANELREDVDSWLKDNPDPALQLMKEGTLRPLSQAEADLHSELARRMVDTTNPDADLEWFQAALADLRRDGGR